MQRQAEISNKNQAKAKRHPGSELFLINNYSLSSFTLGETKLTFWSMGKTAKRIESVGK